MKALICSLLILLSSSVSVLAQHVSANEAKRRMDVKYGFRTARFETDTSALNPRRFVFAVGPVRYYERPSDTLQVGSAHLASILYGFVTGKLAEVSLSTTGLENTVPLREAFQAQYGEGCTICGPSFLWGSDTERIEIEVKPISGDGVFSIYSKALRKKVLAERKKAGQQAARDL